MLRECMSQEEAVKICTKQAKPDFGTLMVLIYENNSFEFAYHRVDAPFSSYGEFGIAEAPAFFQEEKEVWDTILLIMREDTPRWVQHYIETVALLVGTPIYYSGSWVTWSRIKGFSKHTTENEG